MGSCAHCSPASLQVALATYSYRSLPWLLLNRSTDLPAVLEQIRTMRYEEPSGNAIGEELNQESGQQLVGTHRPLPSSFSLPRGSHHLRQDLPAEPQCRAPVQRASSAGGPG